MPEPADKDRQVEGEESTTPPPDYSVNYKSALFMLFCFLLWGSLVGCMFYDACVRLPAEIERKYRESAYNHGKTGGEGGKSDSSSTSSTNSKASPSGDGAGKNADATDGVSPSQSSAKA